MPTSCARVRALTFGYLERRAAPSEDLAGPPGISKQALGRRLQKPSAPDSFKRALPAALRFVLDARPALAAPLLASFDGVFPDDSTSAWLPDDAAEDFPGTGGTSPDHARARLKALPRWEEIQRGNVCHVGIHQGRRPGHDAVWLTPRLCPEARGASGAWASATSSGREPTRSKGFTG